MSCPYLYVLAVLGSHFFFSGRSGVCLILFYNHAKVAHAEAKARFRRFLQGGYLERVLQDRRLSRKTRVKSCEMIHNLASFSSDFCKINVRF